MKLASGSWRGLSGTLDPSNFSSSWLLMMIEGDKSHGVRADESSQSPPAHREGLRAEQVTLLAVSCLALRAYLVQNLECGLLTGTGKS